MYWYSLIPALLVPLCGALAFIAYRHPMSYAALRPGMNVLLQGICFIFTAYLMGRTNGASDAYIAVSPFLDPQNHAAASAAYDATRISFELGALLIGIPGGLAVYLVVIEEICKLLNHEKKLQREKREED